MAGNATTISVDRFGNAIDPTVRYARGSILTGSLAEYRRRSHALNRLRERIAKLGRDQVFNFTGHHREYIATSRDIEGRLAEEWIGQTLIEPELEHLARRHFGAPDVMGAAVFNRTSAAIVAITLALARAQAVLAIAPARQSHVSVRRAAGLAAARLIEADPDEPLNWREMPDVKLVFLTRLTSELVSMNTHDVKRCVEAARRAGKVVVIDDAYGARLGPLALQQPNAFAFDTDLAVTSCDKAGLAGPRAGLLVGTRELVELALAQASEIGLEARAPVALGVLEALRRFDSRQLLRDCELAETYTKQLRQRYGSRLVRSTVMGPAIPEEDVLSIALALHSLDSSVLVPCEASCALAMILMEDAGFLTSNIAERPGARVSLRLRPLAHDIDRMGGISRAVDAIESAMVKLRPFLTDGRAAARLILGADA